MSQFNLFEEKETGKNVNKRRKFLNKIFLQKTNYRINQYRVESLEENTEAPLGFNDALYAFNTGQVYEVLYKDNKSSTIKSYSESHINNKKFLIYIITQDVVFNNETLKMVYIKDITFGVLYEQIKA